MALSRKIKYIRIRNLNGGTWDYTLKINAMDADLGQENWTSAYDEALSGDLRTNLRGFRLSVDIDWQKILADTVQITVAVPDGDSDDGTDSTIRAVLNNIVTSLVTNNDRSIEISLDYVNPNWIEVVPESLTQLVNYKNQISKTSSKLSFKGRSIITSIPLYLEQPGV